MRMSAGGCRASRDECVSLAQRIPVGGVGHEELDDRTAVMSPLAFRVGLAPGRVAGRTVGQSARQRDSLQASASLSAPGRRPSHSA